MYRFFAVFFFFTGFLLSDQVWVGTNSDAIIRVKMRLMMMKDFLEKETGEKVPFTFEELKDLVAVKESYKFLPPEYKTRCAAFDVSGKDARWFDGG